MSAFTQLLSPDSTLALNDGNRIPVLGFGVFQVRDGSECENAVRAALEAGYRHIDTAHIYGNEASVGKAVAASGVPREKIFITTKTPPDQSPQGLRKGLENSLRLLRADYVDLYLIHWPLSDVTLAPAWETLQQFRAEGKCRSIGVSNITVQRFEKALLPHTSVIPAVNQVEVHVFCRRRELVDYCAGKGIVMEAYSPLARAQRMGDPTLARIAGECGVTPAQVMIRWVLQHGIVALPKSSHPSRIKENCAVFGFSLSDAQMAALDALDEEYYSLTWRPQGYY